MFKFASHLMKKENELKEQLEKADKMYRAKINSNTTKLNETCSQ